MDWQELGKNIYWDRKALRNKCRIHSLYTHNMAVVMCCCFPVELPRCLMHHLCANWSNSEVVGG